jgi:hypothetical protein
MIDGQGQMAAEAWERFIQEAIGEPQPKEHVQ